MANLRIHFTKAAVASLGAPTHGKSMDWYDDSVRGLLVRVSPKGTKSFYVLRKFRGRTERIMVGRFPETTIAQARTRAYRVNSDLDAGVNANEIKRRRRGERTLDELFSVYMERHVQPHTRRPDVTAFDYHAYVQPSLGSLKLSSITQERVSTLHRRLAREKSTRTANKAHTLLRAIFNRARDWNIWPHENPTTGIHRFHEKSRDRLLMPDELRRLFGAMREESSGTIRDFFLMLLLTGVRRSNAQAMRWADINLESGIWHIQETKNGEPLTLPLVQEAIAILARRRELVKGEFVFPGTGRRGHIEDPKRAWARLLNRANIEDLRVHDLRHAFGSYLAASGANQFVIKAALGHKDIQSSARYVQLDLEAIREAMRHATPTVLNDAWGLIPDSGATDIRTARQRKGNS